MLGIEVEGRVASFFEVPVGVRVFEQFLLLIGEGLRQTQAFPQVDGVQHLVSQAVSAHGLRVKFKAEAGVEGGSIGKEPFQLFQRRGRFHPVGKMDGEVSLDSNYYLYDCYPLQFIETDAVKANREKNTAQWETFTNYLESKGKLKK